MVADLFSLLAQSASTEGEAEKGTKDSRGVGMGKAEKRLVRRLEQTSSVCLRRQLPRRGKPRKGELRRQLLQKGKPRKGELRRALLQKGSRERNERQPRRWNGQSGEKVGAAVGADLFSLLGADSFPEGRSRERANCAERFYRRESRERNERQPGRWNGQSREGRNDSAACGHKNR